MDDRDQWLVALQRENAALRQRVADLESRPAAPSLTDAVVNALHQHVAVVHADGTIVAVNARWNEFARTNGDPALASTSVGVNYFAVCRRAIADHMPSAREMLDGLLAVLNGERSSFELEYACPTPDGQFWYLLQVLPLFQRTERHLLVIHTDITARKQAERHLRQSEARFRSFIEQSTDMMALFTADGHVCEWNTAAERLVGLPRHAVIGQPYSIVTDTLGWAAQQIADRVEVVQNLINASRTGQSPLFYRPAELPIRTASGERRILEELLFPIQTEDGYQIGVIARDVTERKQAEDALRASEERFRALIEHATNGMVLIDEQGTVIEWNHAQEQIMGLARAEVIGRPAWDVQYRLLPAARRAQMTLEALRSSFVDMLATGQSVFLNRPAEGLIETPTGELKTIIQNGFAIPTANGYRMGIVIHDITERKRMEEALHESQSLYHSLVEISPLCICRKDLAGRFTFANRRYLEETQVALADLLGKTDFNFHPPELAEKYRRDDQIVIDTNQVQELVEERTLLNGGSIMVQSIKTPIHDGAGRVNGVQISFWDVTARQRTEQALERRATQLSIINYIGRKITTSLSVDDVLERAADLIHTQLGLHHVGIFIFDADRTELILRSRAGDYTHLFAADHRLKIDQGVVGWVARHGQRLLANDVQAEPRYVNKYGEALPTRAELAVPIMISGEVRGVLDVQSPQINAFDLNDVLMKETLADQIAIALENARLYEAAQHEIAERQQAERALRNLNTTLELRVATRTAELQAANLRLTELDRLKDEFLSRISHELRTPLTSIKIYLELLPTAKPEKQSKYLETLTREADRLHTLIEDVLIFSQLGHYAEPTAHHQIDLNDWLLGRLTTWRKLTHQHDLTLQLNLSPELPRAQADVEQVMQVVARLMTNAVNYSPTGNITLSTALRTEEGQRWATISVTDTGQGITPEDLPHIFERFYRGRAAADYKTPGTGIGLAISREIIEHMGGKLTVCTQPGVGSTFTIWLPAV